MEITHILPENERNNFPNPREGLDLVDFAIAESVEPLKSMAEFTLTNFARAILEGLRMSKSKLTVKALLATFQRDMEQFLMEGFFDGVAWAATTGKETLEKYLVVVIKHLANDGFIKLSNAVNFEDREIVKYHATAKPKFKSGKFQL